MAQSTIQTQLCPHCANSIGADELKCPYCKAELSPIPQWPEREERSVRFVPRPEKQRLTVKSKAILGLGLLVFALGVYLVGAQQQRSDLGPTLAIKQQQIEERDQKLKSLEEELVQLRQQSQGSTAISNNSLKNSKQARANWRRHAIAWLRRTVKSIACRRPELPPQRDREQRIQRRRRRFRTQRGAAPMRDFMKPCGPPLFLKSRRSRPASFRESTKGHK